MEQKFRTLGDYWHLVSSYLYAVIEDFYGLMEMKSTRWYTITQSCSFLF
jgi:hypothetical protein